MSPKQWQCGNQGKEETQNHTALSLCCHLKPQHELLQQQRWFVRAGFAYQSIATSESPSASQNVPSDVDLEQIAWVMLDKPTRLSDVMSILSFHNLHIYLPLWEERKGKPMAFKKWKWKRCLQMRYQSCDDQDLLCLPLQSSVIRETFIWSVFECNRDKKISASCEQHKVHDLHTSQSNFIL